MSLLLALLTVFSLCTTAYAEPEPTEASEPEALHALYINPMYAGVVTEADILSLVPDEPATAAEAEPVTAAATVSTTAQAGVYLRQCMTARQGTIVFDLTAALTQADLGAMFETALAHTGVPTEGDYLRWQIGGWYATGRPAYGGYSLTYTVYYYTDAAQEAWVSGAVANALGSLSLGGKSDYEKVRAIYNYICDTVRYDYAHVADQTYELQFTAYAALHDRTAVCQGYANLLYRMALTAGVDCRVITSYRHAWNIVRLSGRYYNVDATWDSEYPESRRRWFLLSDGTFADSYDHMREYPWNTAAFYAQYPMGAGDYTPGMEPEPTPVPTATPVPQLPAPSVTITQSSDGIRVMWPQVPGAPRYMVYYKENNGPWTRIGTTTATAYTRKAANLKPGATYQFTVRCCSADKKTLLGPYEASNALEYTLRLAAPTVRIAKVANGIKVTWNQVPGAPRYMVYYKENGGPWTRIGTTTATAYTRKAANLTPGATYQFTVRCCSADKKTLLGPYKASGSLKYTR